mgnify:CR=1 FL=1
MKTKDIQELYQIKLHSMDTILHQISLMDQVENEQELSEIIHSLLQAIGKYTGADRVYVFDWETNQKDSLSNTFEWCADGRKTDSVRNCRGKAETGKLVSLDFTNVPSVA